MRDDRPRFVYFIRPVGMAGPIKIGSSVYPDARIQRLALVSPFKLEIAATTPGTYGLELNIQEHFFHARSHGEWFLPVPELVDGIERIAAGAKPEEVFDLSKRHGRMKSFPKSAETRRRMSAAQKFAQAARWERIRQERTTA